MTTFIELINKVKLVDDAIKLLATQIEITPKIQRAIDFAQMAHDGQFRKSGEPYVIHPILVAAIAAAVTNDETMVIAALLHDVVEDTPYTLKDIKTLFGDEVALLVEGLTKIVEIREDELIPSTSNEKLIKSALSFRKMLLISIQDMRVLVVKLCDRLHNMLTLDALPPKKQKRIAEETLVVYAPIAHRLGIAKLKNYLEDLAFKYIYPKEYEKIDKYINSHKQDLNLRLNTIIKKVSDLLTKEGFDKKRFQIIGRVKHYYSIFLKMQRKGISIEEILDLLAIRIITKEAIDCYKILGILHLHYNPIISRFKDYIALPKDNGYQTIHTTLFFEDDIAEVQIRTQFMQKIAEYGIAAHWKYKEGGAELINLDWLNNLPYQAETIEKFYEAAKADLFSDDIVVYSPKGDHYTLPRGAVALDFAYAIHSEVGDLAVAAYVNKEKTSLLKQLHNGDIVKIITQDKPRLHCSWINNVKTSRAKEGIKILCNKRFKEINIKVAKKILATLFEFDEKEIEQIIQNLNISKDFLAKVPNNINALKELMKKISQFKGLSEVRFWEILKKGYKKPTFKKIGYFRIFTNKTITDVDFDYCCHPRLGDEIVMFYENGIALVHHKLCQNAYKQINQNNTPMLFARWKSNKTAKYRLIIALQNKKGALLELLKEIESLDLNIINIELGIKESQSADYCRIEVESTSDNKNIIEDIISKKFKLIELISLQDAYKK